MTIKNLWSKACQKFSSKNSGIGSGLDSDSASEVMYQSSVGLMDPDTDGFEGKLDDSFEQMVFKKEQPVEQKDKTEVLVEAFERLVDKLENINDTFNKQLDRDEKIADILSQLPEHADKQTEALVDINRMLSDSAEVDSQLTENFTEFSNTLSKLNTSTVQQSDMLMQMNRTYAASDICLRDMINRQNTRFLWMFFTSVGICSIALITTVLTLLFVYSN